MDMSVTLKPTACERAPTYFQCTIRDGVKLKSAGCTLTFTLTSDSWFCSVNAWRSSWHCCVLPDPGFSPVRHGALPRTLHRQRGCWQSISTSYDPPSFFTEVMTDQIQYRILKKKKNPAVNWCKGFWGFLSVQITEFHQRLFWIWRNAAWGNGVYFKSYITQIT